MFTFSWIRGLSRDFKTAGNGGDIDITFFLRYLVAKRFSNGERAGRALRMRSAGYQNESAICKTHFSTAPPGRDLKLFHG